MIILKGLLPYLSFLLNNQLNGRLILLFLDSFFYVLTKIFGVRKLRSDGQANNKCHFRFLPVDYPVRLSSGACAGNNRELKETTTAMATRTAKRAIGFDKQNNNFVRTSRFFAHFFCRHCTTTT